MDKENFDNAIARLKLDEGWFATVPRDLLYLALTRERIPSEFMKQFSEKYGTLNHQTLEFFGDSILGLIGTTLLYDRIGLTSSFGPEFNTLVSNAALTDLAVKTRFCNQIVRGAYCSLRSIDKIMAGKHNYCGDSIEALIGALYIYGYESGQDDVLEILTKWFKSFPAVQAHLPVESSKKKINWNMTIDMSPETSQVWSSCQGYRGQYLPFLPASDQSLLEYIDELAQYLHVEPVWTDHDQYVSVNVTGPGTFFFGVGDKATHIRNKFARDRATKEAAIQDLIEKHRNPALEKPIPVPSGTTRKSGKSRKKPLELSDFVMSLPFPLKEGQDPLAYLKEIEAALNVKSKWLQSPYMTQLMLMRPGLCFVASSIKTGLEGKRDAIRQLVKIYYREPSSEED